ncbi:PREDICTED: THAP domain-containing protein 6-like [Trachymyrmex cornetzi]|uniref:THAP domain-containing protein 6-like n=1 Tax=Trachymyrmex cornetzi TaxID=471704 RepID=UPI00084F7E87|nr:PREDICTED: THAP domain-containing protein 6-like [Trachymyrmex cornetzi]
MVGCAAPFCNNSSTKGYTMKVFPRNAERRALWAKHVGQMNSTPTNNSYLCEVHFAPEMWDEKAKKRKLKPDAVPTIFGFFLKKKKPVETENNTTQVVTDTINNNTNYNESDHCIDSIQLDQRISEIQEQECQVINDATGSNEKEEQRNKKLEEIIRKQQLNIIRMRKTMKSLRFTIHTLKHKDNNDKYFKI